MTHKIWYPYAQAKLAREPFTVASATGCTLTLDDGRTLIDSIASWWCVIHGYNHPALNEALQRQAESLSHVMLGGLSHGPARDLADALVDLSPAPLTKVFYADSGSVGVEVAMKMALQFHQNQGRPNKQRFLAFHRAYHGDTTACMSVACPREGMHRIFTGLVPEQFFAPGPSHGFNGDPSADLAAVADLLERHAANIAAIIIEPILQCAGGFFANSPDFLKGLRALADRHGCLLIFDEVAVGFGRTGPLFATNHTEISPDIMVLGKGLTCGYVGHAATLTTDAVYAAFYDDDPWKAFMHGPTFMGNPLACAVALGGLNLYQADNYGEKIRHIETILHDELDGFTTPGVHAIRILGAMAVIEAKPDVDLRSVRDFAAERGVWLRPFEQYLYTMPPYVISERELRQICGVMKEWYRSAATEKQS